jgi:hypothetical protein
MHDTYALSRVVYDEARVPTVVLTSFGSKRLEGQFNLCADYRLADWVQPNGIVPYFKDRGDDCKFLGSVYANLQRRGATIAASFDPGCDYFIPAWTDVDAAITETVSELASSDLGAELSLCVSFPTNACSAE